MLQSKVVEKIKTHNSCSVFFFFFNRAFYEIVWKNFVQPDRPRMTIWRMHTLYWVPKATNTHSEHVMLIDFPLQQWLHERASTLRHSTLPVWLIRLLYQTSSIALQVPLCFLLVPHTETDELTLTTTLFYTWIIPLLSLRRGRQCWRNT